MASGVVRTTGALLAADDRRDGAEQAGLAAGGLEQGADEEGGRRLAVGAGDADDVELRAWGRRGSAAAAGAMAARASRDLDLGHAEVQRALDDERRGAALDRRAGRSRGRRR